jgi:hypothetical protein
MDKVVVAQYDKGNPVFCCDGCSHTGVWDAANGYECLVYGDNARKTYSRRVFGVCPFNFKFKTRLGRKRVGQQKTKRNRR